MIFYRDSFEGVISDLRSPGSVGRPAGPGVVRTCAGDREVEIYDMFHTPGTYTPPTADFIAMTHDSYYTCILRSTILVFGIDNVEAGCMAP